MLCAVDSGSQRSPQQQPSLSSSTLSPSHNSVNDYAVNIPHQSSAATASDDVRRNLNKLNTAAPPLSEECTLRHCSGFLVTRFFQEFCFCLKYGYGRTRFHIDSQVHCVGAHPPFPHFQLVTVKPS